MLRMMILREIVVKEGIRYMPKVFKRSMRYVLSISTRRDGGILLLFPCVIGVIKCTKFFQSKYQ
jgi:hypothetical protein